MRIEKKIDIQRAIELYEKNPSLNYVASELNVSPQLVKKAFDDVGYKLIDRREAISRAFARKRQLKEYGPSNI